MSEKKEELKKDEKKKKKKRIDGDTLTVLTVLGIIIVVAVFFALMNAGGETPKMTGNMGNEYKSEDRSTSLAIVLTCAFASVFVICLFVIKKIRDAKRNARKRAIEQEKLRKLKEIEEARERVQQARMNEFLNAGKKELNARRKNEQLLRNSRNSNFENENKEGYVKRDLNAFKEDDDLENYFSEEEEEKNFILRILHKISQIFRRNEKE